MRDILSYGHSLENTIYTPKSLSKMISVLTMTPNAYEGKCRKFLRSLAIHLNTLQLLEIASCARKEEDGVRILGQQASHLVCSSKDFIIDVDKVRDEEARLSKIFTDEEIHNASKRYRQHRGNKYLLIRGHVIEFLSYVFVCREVDSSKSTHKVKVHNKAFSRFIVSSMTLAEFNDGEIDYINQKLTEAIDSLE